MKNKKVLLSLILATTIFGIIVIFDLLSKHFIVKALPHVGDSTDFLPGFINFVFVKNTGAAWGMLAGRPIFLIVVSIIVLSLYIWFYILQVKRQKEKTSIVLGLSVGFIAGGCIGNLVDRIFLGYVRDFINFQFFNFPVFNVADVSLTIGIILLLIYFVFIYLNEEKARKNVENNVKNIEKDYISIDNVQEKSEQSGNEPLEKDKENDNER